MRRKNILYCDFGTYCDFSISHQVITRLLEKNFQVCYCTSDNNTFLKYQHPFLQVETYPSVPVLEMVPFAQNRNIVSHLLTPWKTIHTIRLLSKQMNTFDTIVDMIKKHFQADSTKAIILTYPLLCVLKRIQSFVLPPTPLILFYVTPGFPNRHLPWIFDSLIKDPHFPLYRYQNRKEHLISHSRYSWGISVCADWKNMMNLSSPNNYRDWKKKNVEQQQSTTNLFIISAWNKDLIPSFVSPLSVSRSHWFAVNAIMEYPPKRSEPLPRVVRDFVRKDGVLVFMTLGSMQVPNMESLVRVVIQALQQQDVPMKLLVQDHKKQLRLRSQQNLLVYHGEIPYTSLLPKTGLLITTGSYCIQHLALLFHVPMLFVPILTEQYFWAKNYHYHTQTPYLDQVENLANTSKDIAHVASLISTAFNNQKYSSSWWKQQRDNLQKYNGTKQFVSSLEKIIKR